MKTTKIIAYTILDNGVDGKAPTTIVAAFRQEHRRDTVFDENPNKAYLSKGETIIDLDTARAAALAKLNGIDKLILFPDKLDTAKRSKKGDTAGA